MKIRLFEDDAVDRLSPISTSRPAYAISCGGMRLLDVVFDSASSVSADVRRPFVGIQSHEYPEIDGDAPDACDWLLNARLVPRCDLLKRRRFNLKGWSVSSFHTNHSHSRASVSDKHLAFAVS